MVASELAIASLVSTDEWWPHDSRSDPRNPCSVSPADLLDAGGCRLRVGWQQ